MKKETVSVVGLGFVGFPMACILASKKDFFNVIGIDKDIEKIKKEKIEVFKKNANLFEDKDLNKICQRVINKDRIHFSNNIKNIEKSDVVIICINFDFKKNKLGQLRELKSFFSNLSKFLKKIYDFLLFFFI